MSNKGVIGGEFAIDCDRMVTKSLVTEIKMPMYSLGRTCLYVILDRIQKKHADLDLSAIGGVLLPDYICYSIAEVPERLGIKIHHYHINEDLLPDVDSIRSKMDQCSAILLVNYFGIIDLDHVISLIREFGNLTIIIDDVQNYYGFGKNLGYDYCFTSYRKWFAVPDGAPIIQRDNSFFEDIDFCNDPEYVKYKVAGNLLKKYSEFIGDDVSLELLNKGERMMDEEYLFPCSTITNWLINNVDSENARIKRTENAKILHDGLKRLGVSHKYRDDCAPLHIPIILKPAVRDYLREKMRSENIFCPIHWPLVDKVLQGSNSLYDTELSLICDQRYDEKDMNRILGVVRAGL